MTERNRKRLQNDSRLDLAKKFTKTTLTLGIRTTQGLSTLPALVMRYGVRTPSSSNIFATLGLIALEAAISASPPTRSPFKTFTTPRP